MWAKLKCRKAFFMPTIVVYLIFLFSFIGYQVIEVCDYMQLVKQQETALQLYSIRQKVIDYVKKDMKKQYQDFCIIPTTYKTLDIAGNNVHIKQNCLRKQPHQGLVPLLPEYKSMKALYELLYTGPNQISKVNLDSKRVLITSLATLQINSEWIGAPIDMDIVDPLEWPRYSAIQGLGYLEVYTIDIKFNDENYDMIFIVDIDNDKITNVFFT